VRGGVREKKSEGGVEAGGRGKENGREGESVRGSVKVVLVQCLTAR
jgi:hypothetical protein